MAREPENFKNTTQLSSTAADVVAAIASNSKAVVRKLSFYNSGSSNRTVTVYVIASAGSAGTTNILAVKTIPPGKTWNCIEIQGEVLTTGMKVQAKQDSGTDVNANCSGVSIT
jgi:hypothetical protein